MTTRNKAAAKKKATTKRATKKVAAKRGAKAVKAFRKVAKVDEKLVKLPSTRELKNMEAKRRFIKAYGEFGTITIACAKAGISHTTFYLWTDPRIAQHYGLDPDKHYDPDFHRETKNAYHNRFQDRVLHTGYEKALDGWIDHHYDRNGNLVREEHKYDSPILQMLMKRADPALKEKPPEVNVGVNQQVTVNQSAASLDALTPQQKRLLLQAAALQAQEDGEDSEPRTIGGTVLPSEDQDKAATTNSSS